MNSHSVRTLLGGGVAAALAIGALWGAGPAVAPAAAAPPAGTPWVVSLGDSYISGEAGRWAGNSDDRVAGSDALGATAYFDAPNGKSESIKGCHRSKSAEIHIGDGVDSDNLACSGARTDTFTEDNWFAENLFKPGVDFGTGGKPGQVTMLEHVARAHPIKMIALSVGGNDFHFGDIVTDCVSDFLQPSWWAARCSETQENTDRIAASARTAVRKRITSAIGRIETAMATDGYAKSDYTIMVQNYAQPLPPAKDIRYKESGYTRTTTGGCGLYDVDVNWADRELLPTINATVKAAVEDAHEPNVDLMDVSKALVGHRLCEKGVGLLEEEDVSSWKQPGAADKSEWVAQIRASRKFASGSYGFELQEGLHPNYWGQLAIRNCLRQAYDGGRPHGGACVSGGRGLDALGEPNMKLQ